MIHATIVEMIVIVEMTEGVTGERTDMDALTGIFAIPKNRPEIFYRAEGERLKGLTDLGLPKIQMGIGRLLGGM